MNRNIKREKELYKDLNDITEKMVLYEEIFPNQYIDEKLHLSEKDIKKLRETAEYFWKTDLYECILRIIELEKQITEKEVLEDEEIRSALEMRDTLYLMSIEQVSIKDKIPAEHQLSYYKKKKQSLSAAMIINNRTICITEAYKSRLAAERIRRKLEIYLNLINDILHVYFPDYTVIEE